MNNPFPALDALDAAAKQTKPLSVEQRVQLSAIRARLQELTVAAGAAEALSKALANSADPTLRSEARVLRRLRLALNGMLRSI